MKTSKLIITVIVLLALISLAVPKGSCLDVSVRAIKARESNRYSPNTAWELGYTGKGINIAIIDSGVDDEHESLQGKFVAGVDFTKKESALYPRDGSYNPDDARGHGTFCAGCAMGTGGANGTYKGTAPDAKLVDVKVHTGVGEPDTGEEGSLDRYCTAIEWCIEHKDTYGIDIISMSVGRSDPDEAYDGSDNISQAANRAVDAGIVVVGCIGNGGPDNKYGCNLFKPAVADKVICVGGTDDKGTVSRSDDVIWYSSSRGPRIDDGDDNPYDELKPDVCAPAANITSTEYEKIGRASNVYRNSGGGTSWSCPMVAGICALMLEANPDLKPNETTNPIQQILKDTAEQRGTPEYPDYPFPYNKWNKAYGCGIVDAYAAVKRALELKPPEPNILPSISITSPKNNAEVSDTITISGTAFDPDGNVSNVELKFDDNNWFNVSIISADNLEWNYSWNTKDVENGMHTIYAKAYDGENYSTITSVDVNVYNEVSAGGVAEKTKINPVYLISAAGIIGAVVIVVICVLLFRRKKPLMKPVFPVGTAVPPPVTGVPSVSAQCPTCGNIMEIKSGKRPLKVQCPKCGAKGLLR